MNQREFRIMERKTKKKAIKRVWYRLRQITHKLARRETLLKSKVGDVKGAKTSPLAASVGHGVCLWQIGVFKKEDREKKDPEELELGLRRKVSGKMGKGIEGRKGT